MLAAVTAIGLFMLGYVAIGKYLLPQVREFALNHRIVERNYQGTLIPTGMGLFIWLMLIVYVLLISVAQPLPFFVLLADVVNLPLIHSYAIAISVIAFLGWLDDTVGDKKIKGLVAHWQTWRREHIKTTGWLKIWVTSAMALWISYEVSQGWRLFVSFWLIILLTNALNLLDVRPGRALKFFVVLSLPIFVWGHIASLPLLFPIAVSVIFLFKGDLKGTLMLGDTGSNALGFALGCCLSIAVPLWMQCAILGLLGAMHWIALRSSLTLFISNVKLLNWLDVWGRV